MNVITEGKFVEDYEKMVQLIRNADDYTISNEKIDNSGRRYKVIKLNTSVKKQGLGYRVPSEMLRRMKTEGVFLSSKVNQKEIVRKQKDATSALQREAREKREEDQKRQELSQDEFDTWKIERQEKIKRMLKDRSYQGSGIWHPRASVKTFKEQVEEQLEVLQLLDKK